MSLDYTIEWANQNPDIITNAPSDAEIGAGFSLGRYNVDHRNWNLNNIYQKINSLKKEPIQGYEDSILFPHKSLTFGSDDIIYICMKQVGSIGVDPVVDTLNTVWAPWLENNAVVGEVVDIVYDDGYTIDMMLRCGWQMINDQDGCLTLATQDVSEVLISDGTDGNIDFDGTTTIGVTSLDGSHSHFAYSSTTSLNKDQTPDHQHGMPSFSGGSGVPFLAFPVPRQPNPYAPGGNEPCGISFLQGRTYVDWQAATSVSTNTITEITSSPFPEGRPDNGLGNSHSHPINVPDAGEHQHTLERYVSGSIPAEPNHITSMKFRFGGLPIK